MNTIKRIIVPLSARPALALVATLLVLSSVGCGSSTTVDSPTATSAGVTINNTPAPSRTAPATSSSSSGSIDLSFGTEGRVITDFTGRRDEVHAVTIQPDGKIVAAGETWVFPQDRPRFALARYNADGSLDESFGDAGTGIISTGMTDDEWDYSLASALAIQRDGKLLVAGTSYSPDAGHNVFALARFNSDGSLDASFGDGGRVLTAINISNAAGDEEAYAMALASDGKIVLAGVTGGFPTDFAAVRYLPDGNLDTSFGNGGKVITDLGGTDKATALALQPDGKIVLAGQGVNNGDDWAMVRYMPDGKLDASFGEAGILSTDFMGGEDHVGGVVIQPDGKIALGGVAYVGAVICKDENGLSRGCDKYSFALARYNADGSLDTEFGDRGKLLPDFDLETGGYALALQPDGKLVLAGHYDDDDFAVLRVLPNGKLDSDFGNGGLLRTAFGRSMDVAYALALQPDGKIVAAGTGVLGDDNPLDSNFALTRYSAR